MTNERSPTATDVEKAFTRLEAKLAAYHVELVMLGAGDFVIPISKISTAVNHLCIQKEGVERVGDVVVIMDVLGVRALPAVGPRAITTDLFERPGTTTRQKSEARESPQEQALIEALQHAFGAHLGPVGHQIENTTFAQVEPTGHPKISEGVDCRPSD